MPALQSEQVAHTVYRSWKQFICYFIFLFQSWETFSDKPWDIYLSIGQSKYFTVNLETYEDLRGKAYQ